MNVNDDFLEMESETPSERRARILAANDGNLLEDLVELRRKLKITQQALADRMGVKQATVASFERYDSDPKLSTLRRYAHAVGALVNHVVEEDLGQYSDEKSWKVMSYSLSDLPNHKNPSTSYVAREARRSSFAIAA
jgi:transcriptional regulator with XRE-family HTH domain